uniref:hypothetical protein n=1 Tax=Goniotrichopsis reniformis TaxID=468933 RepID=UPI001FCDC4F5|nr:hypothetical protein MW428_pgp170 [Goniotrichopsis reniformis]UNJ14728.1 hypothetical protein [Goniotrichopsis reniformis]
MSKSSFERELVLSVKSYCSIIYIHSYEEDRLENSLKEIIKKNLKYSLYTWDFIRGYIGNPTDAGFAKTNPLQALDIIDQLISDNSAVILLKDYYLFLKDLGIQRKLRNLVPLLRIQSKVIIITGSEVNIPLSLREIINVINFPLPGELEIQEELHQLFQFTDIKVSLELVLKLSRACQGLSIDRIRTAFSQIFIQYDVINEKTLEFILKEKKNIISQTQILEFYSNRETINDIGGLISLKQWLLRRSDAFSDKAKRYGLPSPKGLLLVGIQGTGKSLTSKVIANEWELPLVRLDIGKIFGGLVGESESRMRQTIQVAEAMAPCVLWIDEIDKAFSSIESKGDSGTTGRVLATLITWLSEKKTQVFVVATANNINLLPIEILRKGRLDEIFFLGLPSHQEREMIFQVHLSKKRPKSWNKYDIFLLSELTNNFSGAEIEQVIIEAMHLGFSQNRDFTNQDIIKSIESFVPLADTYKEEVNILQQWVTSGRIRNASQEAN